MTIVSIYAVFRDHDEAERVGRTAVDERLSACVNILGPVRSIYRWKNAVESADEVAAIFKTTEERSDALMTRLAELHSYEVPCIAVWPVDNINDSYAAFVEANVA